MQKIALFNHPKTRYGVLAQMTKDLEKALVRRGVDAKTYDWQSVDDVLDVVKRVRPDCTWSINVFVDETMFYLPYGIPHVYLSVDALTYCHPSLGQMPHLVPLFVDKSSSNVFNLRSVAPSYWFPHAIAKETVDSFRDRKGSFQERPYDVVLLGSYLDHEQELRLWSSIFSPRDVDLLVSFAERILGDSTTSFLPGALILIEESPSIFHTISSLGLSSSHLANSVERYIRGLERERVVEALSGRTIHIFTEEQDIAQWSKKPYARSCVFHESVPFSEINHICAQAKFVINSSPSIRTGYHERLFSGLAAGATVIASRINLLPKWLEESDAVIFYTTDTLSELPRALVKAESTSRDQEKILTWLEHEHTWDARLQNLLPTIERAVLDRHESWGSNPFWSVLSGI
jgi:hypothetical protein